MKKLIGFVLGLALTVSSVSAIEFSVGAKANGSFSLYGRTGVGVLDSGPTFGAGVSVIGGIDFLEFGKCKIGTRPEVMFSFINTDFFGSSSLKIPLTFTVTASDSFDWGFGLGYYAGFGIPVYYYEGAWVNIKEMIIPVSFDIYADIRCGAGKILIDVAANGIASPYPYRIDFGVGYLYTF